VKNRSLGATELSAKAKRALRGSVGAQGPQGLPGPQGPVGSTESNAVVRRDTDDVASSSTESVDAYCLPGERVIGGGASGVDDASSVDLHSLDFVDRDGNDVASGTAAAGVVRLPVQRQRRERGDPGLGGLRALNRGRAAQLACL
jgi:hypothetical protein